MPRSHDPAVHNPHIPPKKKYCSNLQLDDPSAIKAMDKLLRVMGIHTK